MMETLSEAESQKPNDPPLSKSKLKKLRRNQEWEANRAKRKEKRKEKILEKKQRKREARDSKARKPATATGSEKGSTNESTEAKRPVLRKLVQLPVTFVLDCGFDELMNDQERKSLGSQVTRCYSDNHRAPFQAHLAVASFGGQLKERFDGILSGNYHSWKNVKFLKDDFVEAAEQAKEWMRADRGGNLTGVFEMMTSEAAENAEVVYLTSDSPDTLTELRPYSTYIIGGLVDRNRHKGICYKKAMKRSVKTAKLPIGEYMQMNSRFILATNHVVEIMVRWLEFRDWGKAFQHVVPKRKGGVLKDAIPGAKAGPDVGTTYDDENTLEAANAETESVSTELKATGADVNVEKQEDDIEKILVDQRTANSRHVDLTSIHAA